MGRLFVRIQLQDRAHKRRKKYSSRLLMFKRLLRTRLNIMQENGTKSEEKVDQLRVNTRKAQERQKRHYRGKEKKLAVGDRVLVRDYRTVNKIQWTKATLIKKIGRSTFICQIEAGNTCKRHQNQIQKCQWERTKQESIEVENDDKTSETTRQNIRYVPISDHAPFVTVSDDVFIDNCINNRLDNVDYTNNQDTAVQNVDVSSNSGSVDNVENSNGNKAVNGKADGSPENRQISKLGGGICRGICKGFCREFSTEL